MKKIINRSLILLIASLLAATSLQAIDQTTKMKLMEEAMIESATTPAQKAMVASYMKNVADEKLQIAKNLRERAERPRAGKVAYKNSERKELLQRAAALEAEAKRYNNY